MSYKVDFAGGFSKIMEIKETYWQTYFDSKMVSRAEAKRTTHQVASTGVQLHLDAFEQPELRAPVIIFNHGAGGYSRLFTPLALELNTRGYTVLLPDQMGQGLSGGTWRDLSIAVFVQNLMDVANWARERFAGPLFMAGGSLGSGLTYHAAAAGAPVNGIICHNLYEFGRASDALAFSRFAWATTVPGLPGFFARVIQLVGTLLPGLPLPYRLLGRFDRMVDRREREFYAKWQADPVPLRWVTLGYLHSMFSTKTAVPYEQNNLPILVINPTRDEMVNPAITRHNYERLAGPKTYAELAYGHWALSQAFVADWVDLVDGWCCRQMPVARQC